MEPSKLLESLFHHVALPPRLPGKQEGNISQIGDALTDRLLIASRVLRDQMSGELADHWAKWDSVRLSLQTSKLLNRGGKLSRNSLLTEFQNLGLNEVLILHIVEQNAALLIRQYHDAQGSSVVFEAFEASPLSESVLASKGALQWDFPGSAVAISVNEFSKPSLQQELATFLEQASTETIKRFAARANKAGSFAFESRDTVDPALITQMLTTLLEANGSRVFPALLRKRVRDEVMWVDGVEKPWRRCPSWLTVRVGVQRHLSTLFGDEAGRIHYKFLICVFLARLMDESLDQVNPETLVFLKAKLCGRLVKLEVDKDRATPSTRPVYEYMLTNLGPLFRKTIQHAVESVELSWKNFKKSIARPIPRLPRYADQQQDTYLTLPNSGPYLHQVVEAYKRDLRLPFSASYKLPTNYNISSASAKSYEQFAKRYSSLSEFEEDVEAVECLLPSSTADLEEYCMQVSGKIHTYLNATAGSYDSNPEQKSVMLLTIMELWMSMDKCAVSLYKLLEDYDTGFPPDILDVLQLVRLKDMHRLQKIRDYLKLRHGACKSPRTNLFVDPTKGSQCFAQQYYDDSPDSTRLQQLHSLIEAQAEGARARKEDEWKEMSTEYEQLIKQIDQSTCLYTTDTSIPSWTTPISIHDDRNCTKCFLQRKSKRFKIVIHEHPLPHDPIQAKAVVFELGRPKAFGAYRDATWKVLATLGFENQVKGLEPRVLLYEYSELRVHVPKFRTLANACSLSLASTTKSFLATHYSSVPFPVSLEEICRPNGLKLGYFDSSTNLWPSRLTQRPTFTHHCKLLLPKGSPFSTLQTSPEFALASHGPSSYKVIASQSLCPAGLNVHEFMAFQSMTSGTRRRWLQILSELGSSNLNFSSEATTILMSRLVLQIGPSEDGDPLGIVHMVFRDSAFCERLLEQLAVRLDGISSNWREIYCMEMLITIITRLHTLAPSPFVLGEASELLEKARRITYGWLTSLRSEIQKAIDTDTAKRCSRYALHSALLCRRTFAIHIEDGHVLQAAALKCFVECAIALQDNLTGDPSALPPDIRNSLLRDTKMTHRLRFLLRKSIETKPKSLEEAITAVWSEPEEGLARSFSDPEFLDHPDGWWIEIVAAATEQTRPQTIHYHLLQGHLLVDGQPLGKLPAEHRGSMVLERLFGNQSLLTYPSPLQGMTYMLAISMWGSKIHIGFRNRTLFVRAVHKLGTLEFIPHEKFLGGATNFDLPARLVENCVHWLNLTTEFIEIRQRPNIWKSSPGNWSIDLGHRRARRHENTLIDPHSRLYNQVGKVFQFFEGLGNVTVMQPDNRPILADLYRLELKFSVNKEGLLESKQLQSEIDPNQDAGTFYGLHSKLVLRKTSNPNHRSIIVPMGKVLHNRQGSHVAIHVENEGFYTQFTINDVLGRLECPADPRLLYLKAELHAYTSFVLPDPLLGRTGVEEACAILESGYCQPWQPLEIKPYRSLVSIAKLTPKRQYYPEDLHVMQKVLWDPELTTTIQYDGFRPIVEAIISQSEQLSVFSLQSTVLEKLAPAGDRYLMDRSHFRRLRYQRLESRGDVYAASDDLIYDARDRCRPTTGRSNVFESVHLLRNWASKMSTTPDLAEILQDWSNIAGYGHQENIQVSADSSGEETTPEYDERVFDKILLSDRLAIEIAESWGPLVNLCRASEPNDMHRLMFLFGVISFRSDIDMRVLRSLLAFSIFEELKLVDCPKWQSYTKFQKTSIPRSQNLVKMMKPYLIPYSGDIRTTFGSYLSSKERQKLAAEEMQYERQTENDCNAFASFLIEQWPCSEPSIEGFSRPIQIDMGRFLEVLRPEWVRRHKNQSLAIHLRQVQHILDCHHTEKTIEIPKLTAVTTEQVVLSTRCRGGEFPTLAQDLVRKKGPKLSKIMQSSTSETPSSQGNSDTNILPLSNGEKVHVSHSETKPSAALPPEIGELQRIVDTLANSNSLVRQQYGKDLSQSLISLKEINGALGQKVNPTPPMKLAAEISNTRKIVHENFSQLCNSFEYGDSRVQWLRDGGLWPVITPVTLLELLRSTCVSVFGTRMKESLVKYALSISNLQRLVRMENAQLKNDHQKLLEEQENAGHSNWHPSKNTDWLLLEIDANIMIRRNQVDVALATIAPFSKSNSVLQMNMGQGKTSCIMPMVAAVLADTQKLVRVIIPKPLLQQTVQLLHARLGGLVGRKLRHIPFSRKTSTKSEVIKAFYDIHKDMMRSSGIIVALPEHVLSFFLSGQQRLSDGRISEATQMINVQAWMRKVSRDVLDESDITLAVKTQLIYPSGSQKTVDGHPHRWETAEALLRLVEGHLYNLHQDFPQSIEVDQRSTGFPFVYFLRRDVEDALISRLVNDICSGKSSLLPVRDCSKPDQLAIKQVISEAKVSETVLEQIRHLFPDKPAIKGTIFLLRGLLVHRILLLTLKKRWNVQYGIHPGREPIAVPFHAKGVPSEQSDFGHPDVAILLTCLAFYHEGISMPQLRQSLVNVLKADDPTSDYDRWTNSSQNLPDSLREWNAINVDDESQLHEIWQHMRYNVTVIEYFLNSFVFPKHAKQFQMKLLAAGWDLPLISPNLSGQVSSEGVSKYTPLTTGFSGTNDNRNMLPLTIKQQDLAGLAHTNAEVLTYLLQFRNRLYVRAADNLGKRLSERGLLRKLSEMKIRILIDAGAQILEMDNYSLVKSWLEIYKEAPAAIYFDEANKPMVLYRQGHRVPLLGTPFAENIHTCLVYMDEAHTRGTDLKLPVDAQGALTLGLGQTKDHTVQAAMRLRQLGSTQSVVFFAPPEVHQSILDLCKKRLGNALTSHDVILWLLEQTCEGIEQLQPLYFSQGADFCRRIQAASDNPDFLHDDEQRDAYLSALRQSERQTIEQLYNPKLSSKVSTPVGTWSPGIAVFMKELKARRRGFQDTGSAVHSSALQEVEQEREVAFEVENVREVQKPVHYSPLAFPGLHKDVISFAVTGRLSAGSSGGYEQAFAMMGKTSIGRKYGINVEATTSKLYVSTEFSRTVNMPLGRAAQDNFQRQANWILWSVVTEAALIVIPEEVERLLPMIRDVEEPCTYLMQYASPVTRKMLHFNELTYYGTPTLPLGWEAPMWLRIELGIFAGRLYFRWEEYDELLKFLGFEGDGAAEEIMQMDGADSPDELDSAVESEIELVEQEDEEIEEVVECAILPKQKKNKSFTKKPLTFLQEWLALRRKGQDFTHTPMGYVCQGKPLSQNHPFFTRHKETDAAI